jgi:hypothetical protein
MIIDSYGVIHVCKNGHVLTDQADTKDLKQNFCAKCSEPIISQCEHCHTDIKGRPRYISVIDPGYNYFTGDVSLPAFCIHCGRPYPWTEQATKAVIEIIQFSDTLSVAEKEDFQRIVPDLIVETPRTRIAILKFSTYTAKAGKAVGKMILDILKDIASEAVKKAIFSE